MPQSNLGISHEQIVQFCRRHHIRKFMLFGSILREDFGPDSDVDVLVEFEPDARVGLMGLTRMELALTELLGRKVDLNTPAGLHRRFRERVLTEAEVVYAA